MVILYILLFYWNAVYFLFLYVIIRKYNILSIHYNQKYTLCFITLAWRRVRVITAVGVLVGGRVITTGAWMCGRFITIVGEWVNVRIIITVCGRVANTVGVNMDGRVHPSSQVPSDVSNTEYLIYVLCIYMFTYVQC